MSQELIQKEIPSPEVPQKQQVKLSDILIHATEKQCSGKFITMNARGEKSYCALGLASEYAGTIQ